jgi:pimeloyl-ACP methyl ester carboxylesterase
VNKPSHSTALLLIASVHLFGCDTEEPHPAHSARPVVMAGTGGEASPPAAGAGGAGAAAPAAGSGAGAPAPVGTRAQDSRTFTVAEDALPFEPIADATVETDRFWGVLAGSGYRIEVPKTWNGMLVMYAHGYAGTGEVLSVTAPSIRRHLIEGGYAWAASSYSKNYYDVRAGVEDTNALALAFVSLAAQNGLTLAAPSKTYIIGHSMGGHVAGAAIEQETYATAANKVQYNGAVPMCGVMGDTELFNFFAAYQVAAQQIAGMPATAWPVMNFAEIQPALRTALFTTFPTETTELGDTLKAVVMNLTGGDRPVFADGFAQMRWQDAVWSTFGRDGKINGILSEDVVDTTGIVYQLDALPEVSADEQAFNDAAFRVQGDPEANAMRTDGVRFIPKVNGEFEIPVVTIHTLGDLYVPFKMQQIYRERADAAGSGDWLVQRAIRSVGHCEFTAAEQIAAFDAMIHWEQQGMKPEGDNVLDPAIVGDPNYGCAFTDNTISADESASPVPASGRDAIPACP